MAARSTSVMVGTGGEYVNVWRGSVEAALGGETAPAVAGSDTATRFPAFCATHTDGAGASAVQVTGMDGPAIHNNHTRQNGARVVWLPKAVASPGMLSVAQSTLEMWSVPPAARKSVA